MNGIVDAQAVTKQYGEVLGLNRFTATFGPGITGLVGPNGAGKSTLFRLLAGQLRVDAGTLSVLGRPASTEGPFRRRIGYCPESPALYDWMTGEEFVRTLLQLDGFARDEAAARAATAINTVGLMEARRRRLRTYSKGMRQRIKLAQSLAHDPELILLDEPLNGVDPVGRVHFLSVIRTLARAGRHVIVSSHILYELERLTDHVVLISNGRALAQGNLHQIRGLIDARPHTIELSTPDPRGVARALSTLDHVVAIDFPSPGRLTVRSRAPDAFYQSLPELVVREHLPVTGVYSSDDNLDAVFRYLTE